MCVCVCVCVFPRSRLFCLAATLPPHPSPPPTSSPSTLLFPITRFRSGFAASVMVTLCLFVRTLSTARIFNKFVSALNDPCVADVSAEAPNLGQGDRQTVFYGWQPTGGADYQRAPVRRNSTTPGGGDEGRGSRPVRRAQGQRLPTPLTATRAFRDPNLTDPHISCPVFRFEATKIFLHVQKKKKERRRRGKRDEERKKKKRGGGGGGGGRRDRERRRRRRRKRSNLVFYAQSTITMILG